ncbi:hypothetical protein NEOLEDRAFT_350573 [Neolentinus lepideus HHB14362 ss-1]|uniref:F-box domain-containing protein n=1 Tax=Neolentinus lepideus HHB14362 ss-1 TaxID=1314782 RepID=A0A165SRR8_9AGAM|nr:hypothetical protein NEOLEDRAFT_350573 [Neolentinus lepideus HHB14362 ss-1]
MFPLPAELSLYVFSFLSLSDIAALCRTSKNFRDFVKVNEETLYRQAAEWHRFIPAGVMQLQDAKRQLKGLWSDGIMTWKELDRSLMIIERNWVGHGTLVEGSYSPDKSAFNVHRFKIDHEERNLITTNIDTHDPQAEGHIEVKALEDGRPLWYISHWCIRPQAHCEFSEGFLVFDRCDRPMLEIWRRSVDAYERKGGISSPAGAGLPELSLGQIIDGVIRDPRLESLEPSFNYSESLRGHFVPHALVAIEEPVRIRGYRMMYPTLAVACQGVNPVIFLYDVRSGSMIRRIDVGEGLNELGGTGVIAEGHARDVLYIDVNHRWVVLCMMGGMAIIPRDSHSEVRGHAIVRGDVDRMIFFPSHDMDLEVPQFSREGSMLLARCYGDVSDIVPESPSVHRHELADLRYKSRRRVKGRFALEHMTLKPPRYKDTPDRSNALVWVGAMRLQFFIAAHMSPSGRHLAVVNGDGLLFVIIDFARVARREAAFSQITLKINLGEIASNLTWGEDDKRLAVVTRGGIYLIDIDPFRHRDCPEEGLSSLSSQKPRILVNRLAHFADASALDHVSCLQMSRTGLWVTYDSNALKMTLDDDMFHEPMKSVCFVDFSDGV